jgi:hypothetical protein
MSKKDLLYELLENYESDTDFDRSSFTKNDDNDDNNNQEINFEIVKSILALKNLIPTNMFYLCLAFNSLLKEYVFKIGSSSDIISKMKEINQLYKSNGLVFLVAFTDLISYTFKKQFMKLPDLQPYSLGSNMFKIDSKVYNTFIDCCSDEYFKLLNYKDIIKLIC